MIVSPKFNETDSPNESGESLCKTGLVAFKTVSLNTYPLDVSETLIFIDLREIPESFFMDMSDISDSSYLPTVYDPSPR